MQRRDERCVTCVADDDRVPRLLCVCVTRIAECSCEHVISLLTLLPYSLRCSAVIIGHLSAFQVLCLNLYEDDVWMRLLQRDFPSAARRTRLQLHHEQQDKRDTVFQDFWNAFASTLIREPFIVATMIGGSEQHSLAHNATLTSNEIGAALTMLQDASRQPLIVSLSIKFNLVPLTFTVANIIRYLPHLHTLHLRLSTPDCIDIVTSIGNVLRERHTTLHSLHLTTSRLNDNMLSQVLCSLSNTTSLLSLTSTVLGKHSLQNLTQYWLSASSRLRELVLEVELHNTHFAQVLLNNIALSSITSLRIDGTHLYGAGIGLLACLESKNINAFSFVDVSIELCASISVSCGAAVAMKSDLQQITFSSSREIAESLKKLPSSCTTLNLSGNTLSLNTLSIVLCPLAALRDLDLSGNDLSSIIPQLCQFAPQLRRLVIARSQLNRASHTQLKKLSTALTTSTSLCTLIISANRLSSFAIELLMNILHNSMSINELDISANCLHTHHLFEPQLNEHQRDFEHHQTLVKHKKRFRSSSLKFVDVSRNHLDTRSSDFQRFLSLLVNVCVKIIPLADDAGVPDAVQATSWAEQQRFLESELIST